MKELHHSPEERGTADRPSPTSKEPVPARESLLQRALALQTTAGCVPREAIPELARELQVTEAQVSGVVSFYPDLRRHRTGRHLVRVCLGESCLANHGARVLRALQEQLRIGLNETTPNGRFTLERVYCVGNCAVGPTVLIDEELRGRVSAEDVPYLLEKYR